MWAWLVNVFETLFGWIPTLIWNGFVKIWDYVLAPLFEFVFVNLIWEGILPFIVRVFRFRVLLMTVLAFAYDFLSVHIKNVLNFVIDHAFDLIEFFLENVFNFDGSAQNIGGFLEVFKYYTLIDGWFPFTEAISFFIIYITAWFLMLTFKIALKIWQALPGT